MALGRVPVETPVVDPRTGRLTGAWALWFQEFYRKEGESAAGGGMTGPSSSTDNAVARFNGTAGDTVQNGLVTINDSGSIALPASETVDGRDVSADGSTLDTHVANTANPHSVAITDLVGAIQAFEATIGQAALASGGEVIVLDAASGETWKVRGALFSGDGTNFSGGGGDRLLSITDGTSTWSVVPAATLQSLAAATWGDTGLPFPATATHMMAASGLGVDIVAKYSGGTADYTAGACTVVVIAERTA